MFERSHRDLSDKIVCKALLAFIWARKAKKAKNSDVTFLLLLMYIKLSYPRITLAAANKSPSQRNFQKILSHYGMTCAGEGYHKSMGQNFFAAKVILD